MMLGYQLPQFDEIGAVKRPCALATVGKGIHQFYVVEFQPLVGIEFLSFDVAVRGHIWRSDANYFTIFIFYVPTIY